MSKVLAHRGYSSKYPENTMLAFEKAVEAGCDGIELDVQLAADGVPVVIHDETLARTTGGVCNAAVAALPYEEIRRFNAPAAFAAAGQTTPVPRFEEVLDLLKNTPHVLNVELKNGNHYYEGMEEKVIALLRQYGMAGRCVLSSFNHRSVVKCRALAPEIQGSLISSSWIYDPVAYLRHAGVSGLQCKFITLTPEEMAAYKANGIVTFPWTPNTLPDIRRMIELDADYIITDRLDLYHEARQA